jgi:hypothetical protein
MAHQLGVSVVRPLVRREPLPSVRMTALLPSAAALAPRPVGLLAAWIVAPMAPTSPAAGLCRWQVRSWVLEATGAASSAGARRGANMPGQRLRRGRPIAPATRSSARHHAFLLLPFTFGMTPPEAE